MTDLLPDRAARKGGEAIKTPMPELRTRVRAALTEGASKREVLETMVQMSLYGGSPSTVNALDTAVDVSDAKVPR